MATLKARTERRGRYGVPDFCRAARSKLLPRNRDMTPLCIPLNQHSLCSDPVYGVLPKAFTILLLLGSLSF